MLLWKQLGHKDKPAVSPFCVLIQETGWKFTSILFFLLKNERKKKAYLIDNTELESLDVKHFISQEDIFNNIFDMKI